ncbi:uncharacterized protein VP01_9079g1, partial [Puccinia sorghi]
MLERALKLQPCIKLFCEQNNLSKNSVIFCNSSTKKKKKPISPEKTVNLVLAAPVYIWLIENLILAWCRYESQQLIPGAEAILINLNNYFHSAIKKPVYLCSTLLNLQVKTSQLTSEVHSLIGLDKAKILAIFKCKAERYTVTNKYTATKEQITSKNAISNSLYKKNKQMITSLDEEIDQYLNAKCEEEAHQPLAFWKANLELFPSLSNMARTYLAVPASIAPCVMIKVVDNRLLTWGCTK